MDDRVPSAAAEVAFYAILSLFPAFIALAAAANLLGAVLGSDVAVEIERSVLDTLNTVLTGDADDVTDAVRALFDEGSSGALTVGLAATVWAMSRGTAALMRAIAAISDVEDRRSWIRQRALGLVLAVCTVGAVAVVLSMFVVGPLLGGGHAVARLLGFGPVFAAVWNLARFPMAAVALVAWAAIVLHFGQSRRTRWRDELPGAAVAGVSWIALSLGFRAYLTVAGTTNPVLGVLGGALTVLLWLYVLCLGFLAGAELNAILRERRSEQPGGPSVPAPYGSSGVRPARSGFTPGSGA